jgi:hypothetical protein
MDPLAFEVSLLIGTAIWSRAATSSWRAIFRLIPEKSR